MEQILKDALFLANVCDTLQISGYIKQELFDEHAALVENINETIARVFKYAAQQSVQPTYGTLPAPEVWSTPEGTTAPVVRLDPPISG